MLDQLKCSRLSAVILKTTNCHAENNHHVRPGQILGEYKFRSVTVV